MKMNFAICGRPSNCFTKKKRKKRKDKIKEIKKIIIFLLKTKAKKKPDEGF